MPRASADLEKLRRIVNDPALSPAQKAQRLALAAENSLAYPDLDAETRRALDERVICDLFEGAAPYRPRYLLADYSVLLSQGSDYLELPPPKTLDEAIHTLTIAYHHTPSITGMPVFIGRIDELLLRFCSRITDAALREKLRLFWRYVDRVLPDAFLHANIGPTDNRVARAILDVDAELKQVVPNLTLLYDAERTGDELLEMAVRNIVACNKPHIANHPIHARTFDARGYAIVSCYNALPLAGGAATLTRLNLREVAARSRDEADFFERMLPRYVELNFRLIAARVDYLFERSGFFESFLVKEGWVDRDRFAAMFGVFAMAEAVELLQAKAGRPGRYGHDPQANALGRRISEALAKAVAARPLRHVWRGHAMLHAQAGLSDDVGLTPGVRIRYGEEPDPITHVLALASQHQFYDAGVSEILTLDETIKANPEALAQLVKGALKSGFREFTANVAGGDLVRVTGYLIRLSDVKKFHEGSAARANTTSLGAEALELTPVLDRRQRIVAHELSARLDQ